MSSLPRFMPASDLERWPEGKIIAQEAQATQQWLRTGGQPEGMPPSSMQ
jgi:hypothetical protein